MGAWGFVEPNLEWVLQHRADRQHTRRATSAGLPRRRTATGQASKHKPGAEAPGRAGASK